MFTGIIQSIGFIESFNNEDNKFIIDTKLDLKDCLIGSSICCDGVCLTTIDIKKINSNYSFSVNVSEETLRKSNLTKWKSGTKINIEKSLKVGDDFSGHFVYGHVDTTLTVKKIKKLKKSWEFEFSLSQLKNIEKFIVEKGSIAINGISLTIAEVSLNSFKVSIIPHTYYNTNLCFLDFESVVNIEFDPLARYITKYYANE